MAADYPLLDVLWTMIIFFCWVAWIWRDTAAAQARFDEHVRSVARSDSGAITQAECELLKAKSLT